MTQFKCDRCGKVDELDKALVDITDEGKQTYICEECNGRSTIIPPSENTCVCCGNVIPEGIQVCPVCIEKATTPIPELSIRNPFKKEPTKNTVDIHKIIDDAMEKRDRTVSIYIGEAGVSVNVSPVDQDKVKWVYREDNEYEYKYRFECSNCGMTSEFQTAYCSCCGEQMHGVRREDS